MENQMNITAANQMTDTLSGSPSSIQATIDGQLLSIPLDPANRHYQAILDHISLDGGTAFGGSIPAGLQAAADAKAAS